MPETAPIQDGKQPYVFGFVDELVRISFPGGGIVAGGGNSNFGCDIATIRSLQNNSLQAKGFVFTEEAELRLSPPSGETEPNPVYGNIIRPVTKLALDSKGNIIAGGPLIYNSPTDSSWIPVAGDLLVKSTPAGKKLWSAIPSSTESFPSSTFWAFQGPRGIACDRDDNIFVHGPLLDDIATDSFNYYVYKFHKNGGRLWSATINLAVGSSGAGTYRSGGAACDSKGNCIITVSELQPGSIIPTVVKISPSGAELWRASFPGSSDSATRAGGVVCDPNNNIYVASTGEMRKLSTAGATLWSKSLSYGSDVACWGDPTQRKQGGVYIASETQLMRCFNDGSVDWVRSFPEFDTATFPFYYFHQVLPKLATLGTGVAVARVSDAHQHPADNHNEFGRVISFVLEIYSASGQLLRSYDWGTTNPVVTDVDTVGGNYDILSFLNERGLHCLASKPRFAPLPTRNSSTP